MRKDIPELFFPSRNHFRTWLKENAETSEGVWLIFGKTKEMITLSANDALEEALCFGWIDGQIQRIDNTKYLKYFAKRRAKSVWSDKNKKIVQMLRKANLMTELGEKTIEMAIKNKTWDVSKANLITDEQVIEFEQRLIGISPAHENFIKMSLSVKLTYTRRYLSFKTEEARQRDFVKIIERLNNNLKPM